MSIQSLTNQHAGYASPLQSLLKQVKAEELPLLNIDTEVEVFGPIPGLLLSDEVMEAIREFRFSHCDTPYLFNEFHQNLEQELKIDQRSYHLIAHTRGEILGVMRVSPAPFEVSHLTPELHTKSQELSDYLEVSRMILSEEGRRKSVGLILCFSIVNWGRQTSHKGLIALCRPQNASRFGFLGFAPVTQEKFIIPHREDGVYRLLGSEWNKFMTRLELIFGKKLVESFWNSAERTSENI